MQPLRFLSRRFNSSTTGIARTGRVQAWILLSCLLFPPAGGLWARDKTDVIVMANGDRVTGEIKKLERGVLYVGFDYVDGTVSLQWSFVKRVESSQLFIVHTQGGAVYKGTIQTADTAADQPVKLEVLEPEQPPQPLPRREVVELHQTADSFWKRLSVKFDSGLMYTKGNNTTQYNVGADFYLRRDLWSGQANISSVLSKSSGTTTSTRNLAQFKGLRYIGEKRWFYSSGVDFLQSSQQGINLQTSVAGGIGRFLKDSNRARVAVTGGVAWQGTRYQETEVSSGPSNAMAGLFSTDFHLFRFKKTSLDVTATVLPVLTQIGRVRTNVNTAYSIQIISNLWWKFSYYGNWDNKPPPTFSGSDYGTSSSLTWTFN